MIRQSDECHPPFQRNFLNHNTHGGCEAPSLTTCTSVTPSLKIMSYSFLQILFGCSSCYVLKLELKMLASQTTWRYSMQKGENPESVSQKQKLSKMERRKVILFQGNVNWKNDYWSESEGEIKCEKRALDNSWNKFWFLFKIKFRIFCLDCLKVLPSAEFPCIQRKHHIQTREGGRFEMPETTRIKKLN